MHTYMMPWQIDNLLLSKKFYEQLADGGLQKRILREAH